MNTKFLATLLGLVAVFIRTNGAPLGTAFTYQGRLNDGGSPASGSYDFRFRLAADAQGNSYVGSPVLTNGVVVASGLFAVTLDFGSVFTGSSYWLEVDVRTNGGGGYSALGPLQPLTPAPVALYAALAGNANIAATANTVAWSSITGIPPGFADGVDNDTQYSAGAGLTLNGTQFDVSFGGNGSALTAAHSDHQHDGVYASLAHTHAAADVVSGTLADARLSANVPRLDGQQTFSGTNTFAGTTIVTNGPNQFTGSFAGDGGGLTNLNGGLIAAGSVGVGALADGSITTAKIASGAVTGGQLAAGAVGTGQLSDSVVTSAKIADGTIVAADVNAPSFSTTFWKVNGNNGTSPTSGSFIGTTDNQPLELKVSGLRALRLEPNTNSPNLVGGFSGNYVTNTAKGAFIGGGGASMVFGQSGLNRVMDDFGVVSGGADNRAGNTNANPTDAYYATVGGGVHNVAEGIATFVGGGAENWAANNNSSIAGGYQNTNNGYISAIGGGWLNFIGIQADQSTIGGGRGNQIVGSESSTVAGTIGGGFFNIIQTNVAYSTIAGGANNTISGSYATIPGGYVNSAAGKLSFAAGQYAQANHDGSFVWSDSSSFTPFASTASNQFSVLANGGVRFVTGGAGMTVDGQAVATTDALNNLNANNLTGGTLVDARLSANVPLRAGGNAFTGQQIITGGNANQLLLQNPTYNNYWNIYTEALGSPSGSGNLLFVSSSGAYLYFDTAGFVHDASSDKRLKRDIAPLQNVLDRVMQLRPVSYHMRSDSHEAPLRLGFIAQEVEPLFPEVVGEHASMKSVAYSEMVPITIGAILELNQKVDSENAALREELKHRDVENAELKQQLAEIKEVLQQLTK